MRRRQTSLSEKQINKLKNKRVNRMLFTRLLQVRPVNCICAGDAPMYCINSGYRPDV
jgi:hypothetical protein